MLIGNPGGPSRCLLGSKLLAKKIVISRITYLNVDVGFCSLGIGLIVCPTPCLLSAALVALVWSSKTWNVTHRNGCKGSWGKIVPVELPGIRFIIFYQSFCSSVVLLVSQ